MSAAATAVRSHRSSGQRRCYAVLAAHGGAGAATTMGLLRLAFDDAEVLEIEPGASMPTAAEALLTTRGSASGLNHAARIIAAWHPAVVRPWLVVMADAPATAPGPVRYRLKVLSGQVRGVIHVPFLWPLRAVDNVADVANSRPVLRAARTVRAALEKG